MDAQEPEQAAVVRPLTLPYVPFGHGAQAEAPSAAHVPGPQGVQEEGALAKVPAGQEAAVKAHVAAPAALYAPCAMVQKCEREW